jgi:uncharacterized glyoxalase superfamily protein PhnB
MHLIPLLPVKSLPVSIDFYQQLGFTVDRREDKWGWAMLMQGECRIMLDESINQHPAGTRDAVVYLYPENIVDYHSQVRSSGLDVPELEETFYGMTEFRLDDPDGNRLWIGQPATTASAATTSK